MAKKNKIKAKHLTQKKLKTLHGRVRITLGPKGR